MNKNKVNDHLLKQPFVVTVARIIAMAFVTDPIYFIVNNLLAIINGASQGFITYMTQKFFESVSKAVSINQETKDVLIMGFVLSFTVIIIQVFNGLNNFMGVSFFKKVTGYLNQQINVKSAKLSPVAYEDAELLDDINKASVGANSSLGLLFTTTTIFTYYAPYFIFMFFYLYSMEPILSISIFLVFIPVALSQLVRSVLFYKIEDQVAPMRREYECYKTYIGSKETRILGAFGYFRGLCINSLNLINKATWKAEKRAGLIELFMKVLTLMGYLGILYLLVISLLRNKISVAAFAAVFGSIDNMFTTMDVVISNHIANMTKQLGTINNFLRFLDLPERKGDSKSKNKEKSICLEKVFFRYPHARVNALLDISLNIKQGETIAIVGENGSGKSTLVKVALGIYEPSKGKVEVGGLRTDETGMKSLFNNVSAVFQNYQRYKMTVAENIKISDMDSDCQKDLEPITNDVGLKINSEVFPDSYESILSREFDGVELSGGQWQRLAIARGLYRVHDCIVLDEPTAAIDPIEEANLYKKFAEISREKTAIVVTHRIGSAKIADRIVVMENGSIIEIGTHKELMDKKGKYSEMFYAQAKWYVQK